MLRHNLISNFAFDVNGVVWATGTSVTYYQDANPNPALQGENRLHLLSTQETIKWSNNFYDVVYRFRTFRPGRMVGPSSLPHADAIHLKANRPSGSLKTNAERAMTCLERKQKYFFFLITLKKEKKEEKLLRKNPA